MKKNKLLAVLCLVVLVLLPSCTKGSIGSESVKSKKRPSNVFYYEMDKNQYLQMNSYHPPKWLQGSWVYENPIFHSLDKELLCTINGINNVERRESKDLLFEMLYDLNLWKETMYGHYDTSKFEIGDWSLTSETLQDLHRHGILQESIESWGNNDWYVNMMRNLTPEARKRELVRLFSDFGCSEKLEDDIDYSDFDVCKEYIDLFYELIPKVIIDIANDHLKDFKFEEEETDNYYLLKFIYKDNVLREFMFEHLTDSIMKMSVRDYVGEKAKIEIDGTGKPIRETWEFHRTI